LVGDNVAAVTEVEDTFGGEEANAVCEEETFNGVAEAFIGYWTGFGGSLAGSMEGKACLGGE